MSEDKEELPEGVIDSLGLGDLEETIISGQTGAAFGYLNQPGRNPLMDRLTQRRQTVLNTATVLFQSGLKFGKDFSPEQAVKLAYELMVGTDKIMGPETSKIRSAIKKRDQRLEELRKQKSETERQINQQYDKLQNREV